jgi:enoyl-[acyl-carrier protein] reductase II
MKTRITELLGIELPIFQAAMSWASSNAPLVIAVSNAGGMGIIAAGPMRPHDFEIALKDIRAGTSKPFGVNIPLTNPRAPQLLDIAYEQKIPVMVASQGGPREHLARFRSIGTKWLHVVASVEHARKAEAAGVDALVVDGAEAGGHPPPSEVSTLVLVRRVVKSTKLPVVASGGAADGAGIAALLALGADAVQLGTRFIARPRQACTRSTSARCSTPGSATRPWSAAAGIPAAAQERLFRRVRARRARGRVRGGLEEALQGVSLKQAALEGDVEWGKVEAGRARASSTTSSRRELYAGWRELEDARRRLASL